MRSFTFPRQLPSISFQPIRYRPNGLGFWSGHIPFACDLVATLRPETFVELGTQMGESYFAFCQSIVEQGFTCQAYAVDTWKGDQHTRPYDDVVFEEVTAHNQRHYAGFSHLLRLTFDEAAERFSETSIDLLHIDGAHTYEAVSHDFLTWWPKVKPGGVVILHDSFERRWDFGVWRLLDELRTAKLPVGEFVHSHGLGVVVKPPDILDETRREENVATALVTAGEDLVLEIRNYYEACAWSLQGKFLHAKQGRPAEWEIITQLFWRTAEESFTETQSVQLAHIVGASPRDAVLHIPASSVPYAGFRLTLTLIPAMFRLFAIRITGHAGTVIWERKDEAGLLFAGGAQHSSLDLDLPESLQAGGQLCLVMLGVDPLSAAGQSTS